MRTLILVEHDNQTLYESTRHVLTAALLLDKNPIICVVGYKCQTVARDAALLAGVGTVWVVDDVSFAHLFPDTVSRLVASIASSFDVILSAATSFGKNILPCIAARLDVAQVSDVTRIIDEQTFEHPIYAGNAIETVQVLDDKKVLSIRTTAFEPVVITQAPCAIESINPEVTLSSVTLVGHQAQVLTRPDLNNATIVVSGGRGLQSQEQFKLVEQLADALGAAVGASRAAVDAGFVSNDSQVGQTGKVVAPDLYIAIGISGAVQHLAGMKDSKVIVAINKDPDAPIFQIATYGLVGDLFELVPELIERIKTRSQCK